MGSIRFLLCVGVILGHSGRILGLLPVSGNLAVQCFYIISGFYMSLILNEKYVKENGSYFLFISNRLMKLYPIYWAVLILIFLWSLLVYALGYPGIIRHYAENWHMQPYVLGYLTFINTFLLGLDSIFFFSIDKLGYLFFVPDFNVVEPHLYNLAFNGAAWTVGLELTFYIIAPFILKRKIIYIIIILLLSLILRLCFVLNGMDQLPWDYMFFPTQLMFFMAGCISYHLYKKIDLINVPGLLAWFIYGILVIFLISYYYIGLPYYVAQAILFILVTCSIPFVFKQFKKNKLDNYLGDLSYPMYMSQALILMFTKANSFPKNFGIGFSSLVLVILFSIFLHHCISRPIEKFRQSRVK